MSGCFFLKHGVYVTCGGSIIKYMNIYVSNFTDFVHVLLNSPT